MLPLLFTMDKLLSHGYLDELISAQNGTFIRHLISCLASETNGCSDVKRLLAIVGVSLALLRPHLETMDTARLICALIFSSSIASSFCANTFSRCLMVFVYDR